MVIYLVGICAFVLGANLGVLIALLLLHGKAESLALHWMLTSPVGVGDEHPAEESMTPAYL